MKKKTIILIAGLIFAAALGLVLYPLAAVRYTRQEFSEKALEFDRVPVTSAIYSGHGGFPEREAAMMEAMTDPEKLWKITYEWDLFAASHKGDPTLLRSHWKNPQILSEQLYDLQREPIIFRAAEGYAPERRFFISNDEIDRILRGGEQNTEYRLGIYSFFSQNSDSKDREKYLKSFHGEYSGYHGGNDNRTYTSKGLFFSHGNITEPYAKVELGWGKITKRISELISNGKFLSEADRAAMPEYERKQLAKSMHSFFYDTPEGHPKPFSQNMLGNYWEGVREIHKQLDVPERVEEIYQTMMLPLWESTPQDDRHYESRKAGIADMRAFIAGTYSVFNRAQTLPKDDFSDIDPFAIRQNLAQRGIVNGQVVDAEALNNDPIIRQVVADIGATQKEHFQTEPLVPPKPKREYVTFEPLYPDIPTAQRQNFRITDNESGNGTASEKYAANVAAIRMLKRIEDEGILATPVEQEILSRYVGWGGLADCFDEKHSKYLELKALLSEEEYAAARASSLTAFYTSPVIIRAMYQALSQMGFRQGNILEPSCGVGNFIEMLPESMADSKVYGVELDSISGRIAQQLYQNASIAVTGFEKVQMPDSFFDVAIGNTR